MSITTRFAPSPTGPLHLGHAYSALLAYDFALHNEGAFLLRIEDIDQSRARASWEAQIYDDLHWLGLSWPAPVMRQSQRLDAYNAGLERLWYMGLLYPCTCTRRDIQNAMSAPQEGVDLGPDGVIYPGTCRHIHARTGAMPRDQALRLDIARARQMISAPLAFSDISESPQATNFNNENLKESIGDIVLSRRDMGTSYHLSVVLDDAAQNISHVVRGADLFEATKIHVLLQHLLNLPTPIYHHHALIRDDMGKRLAKRDDARAIAKYREDGARPSDIRKMVNL